MAQYKINKNTGVYQSNPHPLGDSDQTIKVRDISKDSVVDSYKEGEIITSWSRTKILYIVDAVGSAERFVYASDVSPITTLDKAITGKINILTTKNIIIAVVIVVAMFLFFKFKN